VYGIIHWCSFSNTHLIKIVVNKFNRK
jgi:hypothetical protein